MPLKLQILSVKAAEWEGWCRHRLEAFRAIRKPGRIIKQSYSLPKGVMAQIVCSDICDIIRIWGGVASGFICHPRSDSFPGGVTPQRVAISNVYAYPLVDNDHGSFILTPPTPWTVSRDAENYGNIDWQGSNGTILSWRGPASRHFPLDPSIDYTGYTFFDRTVGTPPFDTDYFTPFGPNVYQSGNILATLPNSKILGAAIVNGVLTVVASLFNGSYSDEVWQLKNGWQKLWAQGGSSPLVCWFFTADGMKAYRGNETLDFTSGGPVYTQITDPGGSATLSIHYNDKYDLEKKGSWHPYREDVSLSISLKSSDNSIVNNQEAETFANVPVYVLSNTGPAPLAIFGPVNFVNPSDYSATGGEGDYTFTFPTGNSCGTQSVTVTDRCGAIASMPVMMPSGVWIFDGTTMTGCSVFGYQYTSFSCVIGVIKYDSYCTQNCYCDSDFDKNGDPNQDNCPGEHVPTPPCISVCAPPKNRCYYVESNYGRNVYGYSYWEEYQRTIYHWGCP